MTSGLPGTPAHPLATRLRMAGAAAAAAAVVAGLAGGCARVPGVYVYESAEQAQQSDAKFDAVSYVDGVWASKVVPTVHDKAMDVPTLLAALKADPAGTGPKYGRQAAAGGPYSYLVKGEGTVTDVSTAPTGPVTVEVAGPDGTTYPVTISTGPVIAGTALRDAVGFIDFSQFTNQLDYADVSTQLNNRVKSEVVGKIDKASLKGKRVTFAGAVTALGGTPASVVPTELAVAP